MPRIPLLSCCCVLVAASCAPPPPTAPGAPPAPTASGDRVSLAMSMLDKETGILRAGGECSVIEAGLAAHAEQDHQILMQVLGGPPPVGSEAQLLEGRMKDRAPEIEPLLDPLVGRCAATPRFMSAVNSTLLQLYVKVRSQAAPHPAGPTPPELQSGSPPASAIIKTWAELNASQGKAVVIQGTASALPYQHMMPGDPTARNTLYLDLDSNSQIVVISQQPIPCKGTMRVEGIVYEVSGPGKGGDGAHREPYLRAERWSCLD